MTRRIKTHLFETSPEYGIICSDLLKQEKFWRNSGQYYIAKVCQGRAARLLNEDISEVNIVIPTESLYCQTKKLIA